MKKGGGRKAEVESILLTCLPPFFHFSFPLSSQVFSPPKPGFYSCKIRESLIAKWGWASI
jgi:hypothetical protein